MKQITKIVLIVHYHQKQMRIIMTEDHRLLHMKNLYQCHQLNRLKNKIKTLITPIYPPVR